MGILVGPPGATLLGTTTRALDASGTAIFEDLAVDRPGTYMIEATAPGLSSGVSAPFEIRGVAVEAVTWTGVRSSYR